LSIVTFANFRQPSGHYLRTICWRRPSRRMRWHGLRTIRLRP